MVAQGVGSQGTSFWSQHVSKCVPAPPNRVLLQAWPFVYIASYDQSSRAGTKWISENYPWAVHFAGDGLWSNSISEWFAIRGSFCRQRRLVWATQYCSCIDG